MIDNSVAYIDGWLKMSRPVAIAAAYAQCAAAHILNGERGER
jgi:hypothetical protein